MPLIIPLPGTNTFCAYTLHSKPYTSDLSGIWHDKLLELATQSLQEGLNVPATLAFIMPVPNTPLSEQYATGLMHASEFMGSEEKKNEFVACVHLLFSGLNVFFCAFCAEVWWATFPIGQKTTVPSEHPDRKEAVLVSTEIRLPSGVLSNNLYVYPILRGGEKQVTLGENVFSAEGKSSGRFTCFLPPDQTTPIN